MSSLYDYAAYQIFFDPIGCVCDWDCPDCGGKFHNIQGHLNGRDGVIIFKCHDCGQVLRYDEVTDRYEDI